MELVKMSIGDIKPAKYNPRKNLKPGDAEFEKLKASIERWDLVEPLVVNKQGNVLVGGHQRLKVCKTLGMKEVQVVLVDLNPTRERLLNLSLNKVCGDWDYTKLESLFQEFSLEDLGITGFDANEIEQITANVRQAAQDVQSAIDDQHAHPFDAETIDEEDDGDDGEAAGGGARDFTVYLSFPDRASAEKWLDEQGIEAAFSSSRTVNVHVGGAANAD